MASTWNQTNMTGGWGAPQKPSNTPMTYADPFKKQTFYGADQNHGMGGAQTTWYGADQNHGMGQSGYQMTLSPQQQAAQPQIQSIDMSQSLYAKALQQRQQKDAAATAPGAISSTGAGADFLAQRALAERREATARDLQAKITDKANPYGIDTEGYRVGVNGARNRLVGQQNREEALSAGRLGGLASGLRGAQSQAMANDQRAAMAGLEAQMYGAERDRATGFESDRERALMQLANGDFSGAAGLYGRLMDATTGQFNTDRNYLLDARQDARAETAAGLDNQVRSQQIANYAREAKMDEATFEATLAAKKQQLEAAKQQGREAAWMSENSWWLGPLKFAVQTGASVAASGLGK